MFPPSSCAHQPVLTEDTSVPTFDGGIKCKKIIVLLLSLLLFSSPASAEPMGTPIKSYLGNWCLDHWDTGSSLGKLMLWECHGGDNQKWSTGPKGYITDENADNPKCLKGDTVTDGNQVDVVIETTIGLDDGKECKTFWIMISVCIIVLIMASADYMKQFAFLRLTRSLRETNTKSVVRDGKQVNVIYDDIVVEMRANMLRQASYQITMVVLLLFDGPSIPLSRMKGTMYTRRLLALLLFYLCLPFQTVAGQAKLYVFRSVQDKNLCLDVRWSGTDNFTPLQLFECNESPAQLFWFSPGKGNYSYYIHSYLDLNGKTCVEGDTGADYSNNPVFLYSGCNSDTWTLKNGGFISNDGPYDAGQCIAVSSISNGELVNLQTCNAQQPNQQWEWYQPTTPSPTAGTPSPTAGTPSPTAGTPSSTAPSGIEPISTPISAPTSVPSTPPTPTSDQKNLLIDFFKDTQGPSWNTTWNTDEELCGDNSGWQGVRCKDGNVFFLKLDRNNLANTLPEYLNKLEHLEHIDVSNNMLTGTIPEGLADLTQLSSLSVVGNQFVGSVPKILCDNASINPYKEEAYNCDRIACPVDRWNDAGRLTSGLYCKSDADCNEEGEFLGSTSCNSTESSNKEEEKVSDGDIVGYTIAGLGLVVAIVSELRSRQTEEPKWRKVLYGAIIFFVIGVIIIVALAFS